MQISVRNVSFVIFCVVIDFGYTWEFSLLWMCLLVRVLIWPAVGSLHADLYRRCDQDAAARWACLWPSARSCWWKTRSCSWTPRWSGEPLPTPCRWVLEDVGDSVCCFIRSTSRSSSSDEEFSAAWLWLTPTWPSSIQRWPNAQIPPWRSSGAPAPEPGAFGTCAGLRPWICRHCDGTAPVRRLCQRTNSS